MRDNAKPWILGAAVATVLTLGGANTANAMSCRVIVTATGTAAGTVVGVVVDIFALGTTVGTGTGLGFKGGAAGGAVVAEYTCPDSHNAGAFEELSLGPVIERCASHVWWPYNPFWNRRDFCTVPINPFVKGRDVSMIKGRQLDVRAVVAQVGANFQKAAGASPEAGDFADDLRECMRSFDQNWGLDECVVTPTQSTAQYWRRKPGRRYLVNTAVMLRALRRATAHVFMNG